MSHFRLLLLFIFWLTSLALYVYAVWTGAIEGDYPKGLFYLLLAFAIDKMVERDVKQLRETL